MKKKMILSVAATAALLMSNPLVNKADAASNCPVKDQVQVKTYQTGEFNYDQINKYLQKYLENFNIQWKQAPIQQPVKQPAPTQEKVVQKAPAPAPAEQQPAKAEPVQAEQSQYQLSAYEQKVVELTNQERSKYGLAALKVDVELSKVARTKSADMQKNQYFDHNSPTYGSPFDMMKKFGITYRTAGENIAMGQRTPEEVVKAWMNSEGHRKNILNSNFTHIGVGHVAEGNYWTQQFIGK